MSRMKIVLKEGHWDLYIVFLVNLLFAALIIFDPGIPRLTMVAGLFVILFLPGYVLVALLFPRKEIQKEDGQEVQRPEKAGKFAPDIDKNIKGAEEGLGEDRPEKTITIPVRLALSVALSLGIVPTIGLILNEMNRLNPDLFGLRTTPMLISVYIFIFIVGLLALIRRQTIPVKERFLVGYSSPGGSDDTPLDRVITVLLVGAIVISLSFGVYIYHNQNENREYTSFYLLDSNREIGDYPAIFYAGKEQTVYVGIKNNEFKAVNYTIYLGLDGSILNYKGVDNLTELEIGEDRVYVRNIRLKHGESMIEECSYHIDEPGLYSVVFTLKVNEDVLGRLNLRNQVFNGTEMKRHDHGNISFYLTNSNGIPSKYSLMVNEGEECRIEIGIINRYSVPMNLNLTLNISQPTIWESFNSTTDRLFLNWTNIYYYNFRIMHNSHYVLPLNIQFVRGKSILNISLNRNYWDIHINKNFIVI